MMAAKTRTVAELSTSDARSELEEIVTYFEQPSADLDQLVTKLERATELAARRRGCVCALVCTSPRPSYRQILGSWVVLPEPVSPLTMTTLCAAMMRAMSSRRSLT